MKKKGVSVGKYQYPDDCFETLKIDKKIRDDFNEFCKQKKIVKCQLIQEFYKTILVRFKDGSMNAQNGYLTMNIFREPIIKNHSSSS